jgi:von Willebrand factor type A domain
MKINSQQANGLIHLIQETNIPEVFERFRQFGIRSSQISHFEKEFFKGIRTVDYHDRLIAYINTLVCERNLYFLLDTSGSMGEKGRLDNLRESIDSICISFKNEFESLHIWSFNDYANRLYSGKYADFDSSVLDQLNADGRTNIVKGFNELRNKIPANQRDNYIIVITDGFINEGIPTKWINSVRKEIRQEKYFVYPVAVYEAEQEAIKAIFGNCYVYDNPNQLASELKSKLENESITEIFTSPKIDESNSSINLPYLSGSIGKTIPIVGIFILVFFLFNTEPSQQTISKPISKLSVIPDFQTDTVDRNTVIFRDVQVNDENGLKANIDIYIPYLAQQIDLLSSYYCWHTDQNGDIYAKDPNLSKKKFDLCSLLVQSPTVINGLKTAKSIYCFGNSSETEDRAFGKEDAQINEILKADARAAFLRNCVKQHSAPEVRVWQVNLGQHKRTDGKEHPYQRIIILGAITDIDMGVVPNHIFFKALLKVQKRIHKNLSFLNYSRVNPKDSSFTEFTPY